MWGLGDLLCGVGETCCVGVGLGRPGVGVELGKHVVWGWGDLVCGCWVGETCCVGLGRPVVWVWGLERPAV